MNLSARTGPDVGVATRRARRNGRVFSRLDDDDHYQRIIIRVHYHICIHVALYGSEMWIRCGWSTSGDNIRSLLEPAGSCSCGWAAADAAVRMPLRLNRDARLIPERINSCLVMDMSYEH